MRITNNMMLRRYSSDLMRSLNQMDTIGIKIASGRKYQRASEDPMTALKALQVRRNITDMDQYMKNIDYAENWVNQTETGLNGIKQCVDDALLLIIQGRNDTLTGKENNYLYDKEGNVMYDDNGNPLGNYRYDKAGNVMYDEDGNPMYEVYGDRAVIAANIRSIQEQLLKTLNTQAAGKYIFGGANTKSAPFAVHSESGHLLFNSSDGEDGDVWDMDSEFLGDYYDKVFFDLGLGFRLDEEDNVDPDSAFDAYVPGIKIVGVGADNLYNLLGKIADAFESDDMDLIDGILGSDDLDYSNSSVEDGAGLFKKLEMAQQKALLEITNMGERSKFLEYLRDRTDANLYDANVLQNKLEAISYEEEIMNYQMQKMVYSACLQTGTYVLQQSLMDYLRR